VGRLVYSSITSLDGYVADRDGRFDWAAPDEEVHAFVNELQRPIGTHLYGRRLYETMQAWETMDLLGEPAVMDDFAHVWRAADKVVYSATLDVAPTARTELRREFDVDEVRRLLVEDDRDVLIGGPTLAAAALRVGLVDDVHQFVCPVVVGGGTRFLPDGLEARLDLVTTHAFASGVVHLAYRIDRP
jgi:dihydrofolate reductase